MFKPEFFEYLNKEKDAWEAVRDVRGWIMGDGAIVGVGFLIPLPAANTH